MEIMGKLTYWNFIFDVIINTLAVLPRFTEISTLFLIEQCEMRNIKNHTVFIIFECIMIKIVKL